MQVDVYYLSRRCAHLASCSCCGTHRHPLDTPKCVVPCVTCLTVSPPAREPALYRAAASRRYEKSSLPNRRTQNREGAFCLRLTFSQWAVSPRRVVGWGEHSLPKRGCECECEAGCAAEAGTARARPAGQARDLRGAVEIIPSRAAPCREFAASDLLR